MFPGICSSLRATAPRSQMRSPVLLLGFGVSLASRALSLGLQCPPRQLSPVPCPTGFHYHLIGLYLEVPQDLQDLHHLWRRFPVRSLGSQTQTLHRCFCTLCQLPGYGVPCLPFLPVSCILLCWTVSRVPFAQPAPLGLAWFSRSGPLLLCCSGPVPKTSPSELSFTGRISPWQPPLRSLGGTSHAGICSPMQVPPGFRHLMLSRSTPSNGGPSSGCILDLGCFILESGPDAH